jgi:hypothetical protein
MTIFRTVSSPKSVYTDQLAQASHTATIANAITQTVQHCSIPGAGIFAGPHRYNNARLHCWRVVVSFVLCALRSLRHRPSFQESTSATTQVLTPYTPPEGSIAECQGVARVETSSTSQSFQKRLAAVIGLRRIKCGHPRRYYLRVIKSTHHDNGNRLVLSLAQNVIDIGRVRSARNRVTPNRWGLTTATSLLSWTARCMAHAISISNAAKTLQWNFTICHRLTFPTLSPISIVSSFTFSSCCLPVFLSCLL